MSEKKKTKTAEERRKERVALLEKVKEGERKTLTEVQWKQLSPTKTTVTIPSLAKPIVDKYLKEKGNILALPKETTSSKEMITIRRALGLYGAKQEHKMTFDYREDDENYYIRRTS